ncbi:FkbM family methyltransferase [Paenarthrobacter sp. NPDC089675]|uniref:FkbM family methyltransferase n=1 Tax=Paenarthrobacter sp. NPDC089675 TaxID=3364376 RepID=UPI003817BCD2
MESSTESIETTKLDVEHGDKRFVVEVVAGDHIGATLAASRKFYEWQFLGTLAEYLEPGDLVIDVGANIGNHSLYFSGVCGADVIAFEPLPLAFEVLQRNVRANSLETKIEVQQKAVGAAPAKAKLEKLDLANVGATSFSVDTDGEFEVSSLDAENINRQVALIKVDAEGMDLQVLRGAAGLISRDRPIIAVEAATKSDQRNLEQFAAEAGYAFIAEFNATPTYVLAPSATPLERAKIERRAASLVTRTHWNTRDLYYRLGLVNSDLRTVRDVQETNVPLVAAGADVPELLAALSARVRQLEGDVQALSNQLADRQGSAEDNDEDRPPVL